MIFPNINTEAIIQTKDRIRFDASKTFVSKGEAAITSVEIEPEAGAGFIDIFGSGNQKNWFLDWEFDGTDRDIVASVRVATDGAPVLKTVTVKVVTPETDKLFSYDADLLSRKSDILNWVPEGRNSFINFHRRAQEKIIAWFDEQGFTFSDGTKITKDAVVDVDEVRLWSVNLTLSLIMFNFSNSVDDVFARQAAEFESDAISHRTRAITRLDLNQDGEIDNNEGVNMRTFDLLRV